MRNISRATGASAFMAFVFALTAVAQSFAAGDGRSAQILGSAELVKDLRGGGYVIFFRHAVTDPGQADTDLSVGSMCARQRNLSGAGRQMARDIGAAFRALGIRVDRVLASRFAGPSRRRISPSAITSPPPC